MDSDTGDIAFLEDIDFDSNNVFSLSAQTPKKIYVVALVASWCGPCKKFMPEYKKVAAEMSGNSDIVFCFINCSGKEGPGIRKSEINLSKKAKDIVPGFRGFPTMCIFKAGKFSEMYQGNRTASDIKEFVSKAINK